MKNLLLLLLFPMWACEKYSDAGNYNIGKKRVAYFLQDRASDFAGRNFLFIDFLSDTIEFTTEYDRPPIPLVTEFTDTATHVKKYMLPLAQQIKSEVFKGLSVNTYEDFGNPTFIIVHNFSILTPAGDYLDYTITLYYNAFSDLYKWE